MKEFENKYPSFWLILGLMLTIFSYGIFNTSICARIFAIPLIRYINIRTKISSIIFMLIGMIIAANITFFRLAVVIISSIGMFQVEKITTTDQTVRIAAGVENFNLLLEDKSILAEYSGSDEEKMLQANTDIINERAKQAAQNEATLLVFPEDAFVCHEHLTENFIGRVQSIARDNKINILFPLQKTYKKLSVYYLKLTFTLLSSFIAFALAVVAGYSRLV